MDDHQTGEELAPCRQLGERESTWRGGGGAPGAATPDFGWQGAPVGGVTPLPERAQLVHVYYCTSRLYWLMGSS